MHPSSVIHALLTIFTLPLHPNLLESCMPEPLPIGKKLSKRNVLLGMLVVTIGLGLWGWYGLHLKDKFFPRRWGKALPGVYRSGQIDARIIKATLEKYKIQQIVCLKEESDNS